MVEWLAPRPAPALGVQGPFPVTVPHIAVGLWVGLCVVLFCPTPRHQARRRPSEDDLLRAYGAAMTPFSLF